MTSSRDPLQTQYILHEQVLETVSSTRYLGGGYLQQPQVEHALMWTESHPTQIGHSDLLGVMLRLNPHKYGKWQISPLFVPAGVCFSSLGPHTDELTNKVERRAARWTIHDYTRTTSVTALLTQLNWQTIEERRSVAHPCLFYKILNGLMAVPLPDYIQPTHRISRYCHSMTFRQIHTDNDRYKYSFFPLGVV